MSGLLALFKPKPKIPIDVVWTLQGAQTVVRASKNRGGAIYSLVWGGLEYVVSDINGDGLQNNWPVLGNLVQTAYSLDSQGESNNPTEAGSAAGVPGQVIGAGVVGKVLSTSCHPAYFYKLPSGQTISPDTISKRVELDYTGVVNLVRHDVNIHTVAQHSRADIVGLCFYANAVLSVLYDLGQDGVLTQRPYQTDPTFNQSKYISGMKPMIVATPDSSKALGIYGPTTSYGMMGLKGVNGTAMMFVMPGKVNNNLSWIEIPFPAGDYSFHVYYVAGTLADVKSKILNLMGQGAMA